FVIAAGLVLGQTQNNVTSSFKHSASPPDYDGKIPPPLNVAAAYGKALVELGAATNQFHCIGATCLPRLKTLGDNEGFYNFGWTFEFSDTNGTPMKVDVYFDKAATARIDKPRTGW